VWEIYDLDWYHQLQSVSGGLDGIGFWRATLMANSHQAIIDAALALPEPERTHLMERLLESVSPELDEVTEEDFARELDRRRMEIATGVVKPVPWSEVWQ
jgi:putative addiction module component (TIGR02574 family)